MEDIRQTGLKLWIKYKELQRYLIESHYNGKIDLISSFGLNNIENPTGQWALILLGFFIMLIVIYTTIQLFVIPFFHYFSFFFSFATMKVALSSDNELFWIVFVVWLTDERLLALFAAGTNFRHVASRVWTCAEPEFRLIWVKLCDTDNHNTTATSPKIRTLTWLSTKKSLATSTMFGWSVFSKCSSS